MLDSYIQQESVISYSLVHSGKLERSIIGINLCKHVNLITTFIEIRPIVRLHRACKWNR